MCLVSKKLVFYLLHARPAKKDGTFFGLIRQNDCFFACFVFLPAAYTAIITFSSKHGYMMYLPKFLSIHNKAWLFMTIVTIKYPFIHRTSDRLHFVMYTSVRPKPVFWVRFDTENETQIGRYFLLIA